MLDEMYGKFPRQIGVPKRYKINNMKEFTDFVNCRNTKVRIYPSVYNYTSDDDYDQKNLDVDKIFFDLDSANCLNAIRKMHFWLQERNIRHIMFFSGGGFHIYVFTKNFKDLKNKKDALYNIQHFIAKENDLTIGSPEKADIDEHIIGDIARIATMLGTWNTKRRRWCICVTESMLMLGYDVIKEMAKKQCTDYKFYGTEKMDIKMFDTEKAMHIEAFQTNPDIKIKIDGDKELKKLPLCISNMLCMKHLGYKRRGYVICFLRDNGYLLEETIQLLEKYLDKTEFIHCASRCIAPGHNNPGEMQPQYFYKDYVRLRTSFPGCFKLKRLGECPVEGFCKKSKELYK